MMIFGHERWNVFELRALLGIVSNDLLTWCSGEASAREVVLSGFFSGNAIYPNNHVERRHRQLCDAALAQVGGLELAGRPVCELSSGEAKRVLIARALVHQPKALLFDEPSNSLDIAAWHGLREIMSSLARSGIGIILVTHDLSDIVPEIERVLLMRGGKIVADGRKEELLRPEPMEKLFGVKVGVARTGDYFHMQ
jgi:iron complex transport system ATP-binding protein